jgi:outer membrane protein OmpA-like peptidoglycan-associated protein
VNLLPQSKPIFQPLPPPPPPTPEYQPVAFGGSQPTWQSAAAGAAPAVGTTPPQNSGSGLIKLLFAGVAILALLAVTVVGGIAYLGYRAKKKVERIQQAFRDKDVNKITSELNLDKVAAKIAPNSALASADDERSFDLKDSAGWKTYTGSPAAATSALVPMKAGLAVTSASSTKGRPDYETTISVRGISSSGIDVDFTYFGPRAGTSEKAHTSPSNSVRDIVTQRKVLSQDLAGAHEQVLYYGGQDPHVFPGTTSLRISADVFKQLKSPGGAPFRYHVTPPPSMQGLVSNLLDKAQSGSGNLSLQDMAGEGSTLVECTLQRASPDDIAYPVILNDKPVELPAIRGDCKSDKDDLRVYILDEFNDPLLLASSSRLGHFSGEIVRINFPQEKAVNPIEQDLKQSGRAQVYGIYFDFASATLRSQSQIVLAQIAKAMRDNPSWRLDVEGHTDNIGGDAFNLDLSRRRSAAVVQALNTQYRIPSDRFTSQGFGASKPVDTNDTLEGRARNRRVELVRQ